MRGLPPVDARWPASVARPSARSRAVILLTAWGVSPVRSASSSLLMRPAATRSRSSTRAVLWLRSAGRFAPLLLLFTAPLSLSLALWQQRCLSGRHDWQRDSRDARTVRGPLRVGLVGYGLAGSVFHAPLIAATDGLVLDTVVTSDEERRAQARAEFPGVRFAASPQELWERADELGLIVIASPNRTHVPIATAALEAGLPVVVDKPIAGTAAEARGLAALAEERGLLLSVFQNRRWDNDFRTLARLLADGELGEVQRFESRFERWRPQPKGGWRESGDPQEIGGLLYDLGSHVVDQALTLFGRRRWCTRSPMCAAPGPPPTTTRSSRSPM